MFSCNNFLHSTLINIPSSYLSSHTYVQNRTADSLLTLPNPNCSLPVFPCSMKHSHSPNYTIQKLKCHHCFIFSTHKSNSKSHPSDYHHLSHDYLLPGLLQKDDWSPSFHAFTNPKKNLTSRLLCAPRD